MENELQDLRAYKEKVQRFLEQLQFVTSGHPFICGVSGELDRNGMPETFHICASFGSDAMYRYKRID